MKMTKKILSIILVVMMLFSVSMVATSAYTVPDGFAVADKDVTEDKVDGEVYGFVGDADMNDNVNVRDATRIQKFAADLITLSDAEKVLADVNFDGAINVKDATIIRKVIADIAVDAPVGQLIYTPVKGTDPEKPTDPEVDPSNPEDEQKIASDFVLHGNFFGDWADTVLYKASADATFARAVIDVAQGSYAFVIHNVATDAWLKNGGTIDNTCEGWTFSTAEAADTTFNAAGGKYTFFFDLATLKLTVVEGDVKDMPTTPGGDGGNDNKDTYTIYFTKPEDWADAYIYGFYGVEGGESEGDWPAEYPGAKMNFHQKNEYGQDVYTYEVPKDIDYIKFCDGSDANRRTNNVPNADIKDGRGYYLGESVGDNKWAVLFYDTKPVEPTPGDKITVYFNKPADWADAYIYVMDGNQAALGGYAEFPGDKMTKVEGNKYSFEIPANTGFIKFTDGTTENPVPRTENVSAADIKANRVYEVDFTRPTEGKEKSWAVKWTDPAPTPTPGEKITVYFNKPADWADAYIYVMGADGAVYSGYAEFPGDKMTKVEGNKYSFEIPADTGFIKFTDGTTENPVPRTENVSAADIKANRIYEVDFTKPTEGKDKSWAVKWTDQVIVPDDPATGDEATKDEATTYTVYFVKPADWADAYIYIMNAELAAYGAPYAAYPGDKMTLVEGNKYSYEVPVNAGAIKFSDGTFVDNGDGTTSGDNKRTENATDIADGRVYTIGNSTGTNKWDVTWEGGTTPTPPTPDGKTTVYFINSANWSTVKAYIWDSSAYAEWPGEAATKTGDTVNGYDVYSYTFDSKYSNIIFTNKDEGTEQTGDLTVEAGKYFYYKDAKWYDSLADVPQVAPPITEKVTIYFNKPADWADAYIYLMDANEQATGTAYPGDKMTLVEGNKYSFEIPVGTGYIKFVDGPANLRTENVPSANIADGRTYSIGASTGTNKWDVTWEGGTTPDPEPTQPGTEPGTEPTPVEGDYYLRGDAFGGWETGTLLTAEGVTVELAAGEYEFKIYDASTERWLKTGSDVEDTCDAWTVREGDGNSKLIATGGKYTFSVSTLTEGDEFKVKLTITADIDAEEPTPGPTEPAPEKSGWSVIGDDAVAKELYVTDAVSENVYSYTVTLAAGTYKFRIQDATGETPVVYGSKGTATDATAAGVDFVTNNSDSEFTLTATGGKYTFTINTKKMQRPGVYVANVAIAYEPAPEPADTITVYFVKPADWADAYIYVMDAELAAYGAPYAEYPGDKMTLVEGNKYSYEIPVDAGAVKFTDGTGSDPNKRTENATDIVDGRVYTIGNSTGTNKWDVTWEGAEAPTPPVPDDPNADVVYFVNTANWAEVSAYTFNSETLGGWPGTAMTKTEDQVHGFDVYKISISGSPANILFHNGSGTQTSDLTYTAGKYYDAKGNMYNSLNDVPAPVALATNRFLAGTFNGWSVTATEFMLKEEGADTCYVELELEANTTYEFKIVREGTWTSGKETLSITDTVSGITFSSSVGDNCAITTKAAGTYVFAFGMSTSQLAVTYPA